MADNQEVDDLEICLQIASSHFDFGDLTEQAKHAFKCCLKGGPLMLLSPDELFPVLDSTIIRRHEEQQGSTFVFEGARSRLQETKQIYEELRAESQRQECSTRSPTFQDGLLRLAAFQLDDALPDVELKSSLSQLEEAGVGRLLSDQPLMHNVYQWGLSLVAPGYPYRPLHLAIKEIRLLVLLPSTEPSSTVECRLVHNNSTKNLLYTALSYVWGEFEPRATIELEGRSFSVTPNLCSALKHLRHESQIRCSWVDAICINQSDVEERNHQVGQMRSMYEGAAITLMWLGETEMKVILPWNFSCDSKREYGERVGIIQEVFLSDSVFVCCGRYGVMWVTLALFLLVGEAWDQNELFYLGSYHVVRKYAADGAATLASLWFQKRLGLETSTLAALMHNRHRHATDLHDHVFGIAVLCQYLARNKILQDRSLDILSACYIFDPDNKIMVNTRLVLSATCGIQMQTLLKEDAFELACRMLALMRDDAYSITDPDLLRELERSWTGMGLDCLLPGFPAGTIHL